jgi:hypothetical protein
VGSQRVSRKGYLERRSSCSASFIVWLGSCLFERRTPYALFEYLNGMVKLVVLRRVDYAMKQQSMNSRGLDFPPAQPDGEACN